MPLFPPSDDIIEYYLQQNIEDWVLLKTKNPTPTNKFTKGLKYNDYFVYDMKNRNFPLGLNDALTLEALDELMGELVKRGVEMYEAEEILGENYYRRPKKEDIPEELHILFNWEEEKTLNNKPPNPSLIDRILRALKIRR